MTDHAASQRDRIGEVAESFVARLRAGERPSIEEYASKYPDLADELRQLLPALVMLEQHGSLEDAQGLGAASAQRSAPRELGDFTIVREIGRGGMGVVYEAVQQSLGRHVALKVLSSPGLMNPVHLERFRLEARSAGRLHHSHIVPVFGVGEHQGLHYYAMQFIAGQSLDQVIEALRKLRPSEDAKKTTPLLQDEFTESLTDGLLTGRFPGNEAAEGNGAAGTAQGEPDSDVSDHAAPPATPHPASASVTTHGEFSSGSSGRPFYQSVARVGLQVAEALAYAHAEGVLHRDIKPSNLMLDAKGNTWVTDFGLAKAEENEALTETGDFVGTLRYMAPERLEGWSDRRSDLYGLGATLYELLTLHPFFESSSRARLIDSIRHVQPQPPTKVDPSVPRDLETIVLKALSKEPASRYHTADEVADDLQRFLADRPVLARRSTQRERFVRWCRHNPAVASLTAAVAVALVAGTIASTWQAIRATRAEGLADARLITETVARRAADNARAAEADQRNIAEARQAEAEANYQKARSAVDRYFTLVSESTLFQVPGLEPLRKNLLEAALEFYEGAALERSDDPAVLADMAVTQMRVSQIYLTLVRLDDAVVALRKGLDSVDRLLREHPNASEAHLRLAGSWKGRRAVKNGEPPSDLTGAIQTLLRFERIWAELARRYPAEPAFQSDLAGYVGVIGEAWEAAGRPQDSVVAHRKGRAILQKLIRDYPTVAQYRAEMMVEIKNLVRLLRRTGEKEEEALGLMREATDLSEALVAEFPSVPAYRSARVEYLTWLGHQFAKDQPQAAEQSFRRASELAESLIEEFPNQAAYAQLWERAVGASPVFDRPMDNYSPVEEAVNKAIERFEARLKSRPNPLVRQQFASFCEHYADQFPHQGDFIALAERLHQRARVLNTELDNEFPGDRDTVVQRAYFHESAGHRLWSTGRMDEAAERFMAAVAVMEKAGRQRPEWLFDVSVLADRTIDLARIMANGARTTDPGETCRLCLRASQMLDEKLKQDPARRAFLAVAVRAYCERLLKGPERLPEAEQMLIWSTPIVEQAINDTALLDKLTADHAAPQYSRHIAATTQQWLAKILTWTNRAAQAQEMWLRAMRSYMAIANDHPDQQIHVQNAIQDYRQQLGVLVEQLVKNGRSDEAVKLLHKVIDAFDTLAAEHPSSAELYLVFQVDILFQLTAILVAGGHDQEAVAAARKSVDISEVLTKDFPKNKEYRERLAAAQHVLAERLGETSSRDD